MRQTVRDSGNYRVFRGRKKGPRILTDINLVNLET
jgi:hypothetical protein